MKIKKILKDNLSGRSISSIRAHIVFWLFFIIGLSVDLLTKRWAISNLGVPGQVRPIEIIPDWFRFSTVFNPGAVWGSFAHKTEFLLLISLIAVLFILWIFATSSRRAWYAHLACGMILAGAFGNIHDRIFNDGYVIDFIEVNLHFWPANPWPTFNIADSLLCVGVPLLIIPMLWADLKGKPSEEDMKSVDK